MEIIKRDGRPESYRSGKIASAIRAAFASVGQSVGEDELDSIVADIENGIQALRESAGSVQVEDIQDMAEKRLVAGNYYDAVKSFILYRDARAKKREARGRVLAHFETKGLYGVLKKIQQTYPSDEYSLDILYNKFASFHKEVMSENDKLTALTRAAVELTTQEAPNWEFVASRILYLQFSLRLEAEKAKRGISSFYEKICYLEDKGLYGSYIRQQYRKEDVDHLETLLDDSRCALLTYSSLDLLLRRYVISTRSHVPLETPQEMFMGIAMHLAMKEKTDRLGWVERFYDMLSLLQVTMATPTLSNARKPYHQLSSCFIDTVPDSLDGIYRSIDSFAKISKFGGGMGLYFGKVRAVGSPIRGFQGAAGGVIRWIKLANDTAVAVDQLGVRQGSVAVYLDVWHKDIPEFLQLRTNNGDDRMKAHDVFPAVCYPDLFWKMARDNIDGTWYLLCPHEVLTVKGYALEDSFGEEWERRYRDCIADPRISKREIPVKELVRLILKSAVETGTPFAFNRDHVNRMNPNSHKGVIYSSNLCTEIAQNMSAVELVSTEVKTTDGDTVVVQTTRPGDFVVCNLASISLGNVDTQNPEEVRRITRCAVRALDNVIDLNFYPVPYAEITNKKYRSIGLGVSGYHHALAKNGVVWESEEHLAFADWLFEEINFAAIEASTGLAREKGRYEYFDGSDWQTGAYFDKRSYTGERWNTLRSAVARDGMRNAWLLAVAPTSSTSIIAGTTAGLDPVMKRYFLEEKKGSIVPRVAPGLNQQTFWLYKNAHLIDQEWVVRAAGVRQRHVDQAQSVNLYITNQYTMRQVLDLYIRAWEEQVKTIYYVRSQALEVGDCEVCSS